MNAQLFDWDSVVSLLKLEKVRNDEGSEWLNACCPIHRDSRPSFGINKTTGTYNCYVCGTGKLDALVVTVLGISKISARDELEKLSSSPMAFESWLHSFRSIVGVDRAGRNNGSGSLLLSEGMLRMYRCKPKHYHSLISRGFDAAILERAEAGYDRVLSRNTFPVRNSSGQFSGLLGRSSKENINPRWKIYWDTRIREQLYNINNVRNKQDLLITEGVLDVLRPIQFQYPSDAVVGIFSATPTKTQIEMIRGLNPKTLTFALDNDEAGMIGTLKLMEAFIDELPVFNVKFPKGTKDLGELTSEQFEKVLKSRHNPILRKIGQISTYRIGFS